MINPKAKVGIVTMALGLLMIIGSSVDAIIDSSSNLYKEKHAFDISFNENDVTIPYQHPEKKKISFWLALPDKSVEAKDFKFTVSILDVDKKPLEGFRRDFAYKTTRQDIDNKFYYKLGSFKFPYDFDGFINYKFDGDWKPATSAKLSLKESSKTSFTPGQILVSFTGCIMLAIGFGVLVRSTSEQGEARQA
ncbi:hypothetical protein ACFL3P_03020 [Pseudomonadota bacterium]